MARFSINRNWPFIAVLCVSLACCALKPAHVRADPLFGESGDVQGGGNPTGVGDPDDPTGPGKSMKAMRGYSLGGSTLGLRAVGDGRALRDSHNAAMWQLFVTWMELRGIYFRF
jgi:hypothetical protein